MSERWKTMMTLDGTGLRLPISSRDILFLLLAVSFAITGLDVAIAHYQNKLAPVFEWIPLIYSPAAALITGLLVWKKDHPGLVKIYQAVMLTGILMGFVGVLVHLFGNISIHVSQPVQWLYRGTPVLAPLAFSGMALLGLALLKPQVKLLLRLVALGFLVTALNALLDHRPTGFVSGFTLVPVLSGLFAWAVLWLGAGRVEKLQLSTGIAKMDRITLAGVIYGTMLIMMIVGVTGFALHVHTNLEAVTQFSWWMMFYKTPVLAPLGMAQLGLLGILFTLEEKAYEH